MHTSKQSGIVALVTILVISGFLTAIGYAIMIKGGTAIFTGQFGAQSVNAQFAAEAGGQDALMRIARDKDVSGSYALTGTGWNAAISIASGNPVVVTATGTVTQAWHTVKRVIRMEVTLNADGKIISITKTNL